MTDIGEKKNRCDICKFMLVPATPTISYIDIIDKFGNVKLNNTFQIWQVLPNSSIISAEYSEIR